MINTTKMMPQNVDLTVINIESNMMMHFVDFFGIIMSKDMVQALHMALVVVFLTRVLLKNQLMTTL